MSVFQLQSKRVGLRKFTPVDLDDFAAMNADANVMEYFPGPMTREACEAWMMRINDAIDDVGFSFWAAELLATGELIGCLGLSHANFEAPFNPSVEIGWRFHQKFWGQGLATEAATRCLQFAFAEAELVEIYSFTPKINQRSWRVMQRIGMTQIGEFIHPKVDADHRLQPHVYYKITAAEFANR